MREAVASIFAQTYSPLEIILSDDQSSDGTLSILEQMAKAYDGPHQVVVSGNAVNFGVARHVNHLMTRARGDLVVYACGDDVALPNRVQRLFDLWTKASQPRFLASSNFTAINAAGRELAQHPHVGETMRLPATPQEHIDGYFIGAANAWSRSLFDTFGPIHDGVLREDLILPFRAALAGGIAYVYEPLLKYRVHEQGAWLSMIGRPKDRRDAAKKALRWAKDQHACRLNMEADIAVARKLQLRGAEELAAIEEMVRRRRVVSRFQIDVLTAGWLAKAPLVWRAYFRDDVPLRKIANLLGTMLWGRPMSR